jgi:hypothetical protein
MQRTGRKANMLSKPSYERNSACLNLSELQEGHSWRIHNRRGTQLGQVRFEKFIFQHSDPWNPGPVSKYVLYMRERPQAADGATGNSQPGGRLRFLEGHALGGASALEAECSNEKSFVNFDAFSPAPAGSAAAAAGPLGRLSPRMDPKRKARRAAKYAGTSLFLIRLMATPLVLLLA